MHVKPGGRYLAGVPWETPRGIPMVFQTMSGLTASGLFQAWITTALNLFSNATESINQNFENDLEEFLRNLEELE
jgi:hypothetical protein